MLRLTPTHARGAALGLISLVFAVGVSSALAAAPSPPDGRALDVPEQTDITLTRVARLFYVRGTTVSGTVTCPAGSVVGGGFEANAEVIITLSYPSAPDQWQVAGHGPTEARPVYAWAICMTT